MRDPDSARFTHGRMQQGYWTELFGPRHWGYFACGTVNARNGFGGYAGPTSFVAVYKRGVIVHAYADSEAGGLTSIQCRNAGAA